MKSIGRLDCRGMCSCLCYICIRNTAALKIADRSLVGLASQILVNRCYHQQQHNILDNPLYSMSITQWICMLTVFTCAAHSAPTSTTQSLFLTSCIGIQMLAVFSNGSTVLCRSLLWTSWLQTAVVPYITPVARTSDIIRTCRVCKIKYTVSLSMSPKICVTCFNHKLSEKLSKVKARELKIKR